MLLLLSLTLFVSGCASINGTECSWVSIITLSKDDILTEQTAREILTHNEKVEAICR